MHVVPSSGPGNPATDGIEIMNSDRPHSVSVAGVAVDDSGRALLMRRRDNGQWEPPGGILEPGETIHECLRREVREETGLSVEPVALTGVYKNMDRLIVALVFRCRVIAGAPAVSDEASELRWATRAEVTELTDEAYAVRILDALDAAGPPAVRAHDGTRLV
jgi:8-oxo-dGTP diphosphatase